MKTSLFKDQDKMVFLSRDIKGQFGLKSVACKCSVVFDSSQGLGPHCYVCEFLWEYESNALTPIDKGMFNVVLDV